MLISDQSFNFKMSPELSSNQSLLAELLLTQKSLEQMCVYIELNYDFSHCMGVAALVKLRITRPQFDISFT